MRYVTIGNILRNLSSRTLTTACAVVYLSSLLAVVNFWVAPAYDTWRESSAVTAREAEERKAYSRLHEELTQKRVEYATLSGAGGREGTVNQIFDIVHAMAAQSGARVRLFEQAGQSSDGFVPNGFIRIAFETNFLQLNALLELVANEGALPSVNEFSARSEGDDFDTILFSLTISLADSKLMKESRCRL